MNMGLSSPKPLRMSMHFQRPMLQFPQLISTTTIPLALASE